MRVLVVGNGGAIEHLLAEQLSRSAEVRVAMVRRNPAILEGVPHSFVGAIDNLEAIGGWAIKERIELAVIVSQEALHAGLSDALELAGIAVASPSQTAALAGWDKRHAFRLMADARISHPAHIFFTDAASLKTFMRDHPKFVLQPPFRDDPFAVRVFSSLQSADALAYAKTLLKKYPSVLAEGFVDGESFVLHAFSDGARLSIMPPVKVRKHAFEGDRGLLTPGMGCYSTGRTLPFLSESDLDVAKEMLRRCIDQLRRRGETFKGVFSSEFLLTPKGVRLLTLDSTLGNPDSLGVLSLLRTELTETLASIARGQLQAASFIDRVAVVKYLVPEGYPENPRTNQAVEIDEKKLWDTGTKFYIESLRSDEGRLLTTRERAVALVSKGETLEECQDRLTAALPSVRGPLTHRRDVATVQALSRSFKRLQALRQLPKLQQP